MMSYNYSDPFIWNKVPGFIIHCSTPAINLSQLVRIVLLPTIPVVPISSDERLRCYLGTIYSMIC